MNNNSLQASISRVLELHARVEGTEHKYICNHCTGIADPLATQDPFYEVQLPCPTVLHLNPTVYHSSDD